MRGMVFVLGVCFFAPVAHAEVVERVVAVVGKDIVLLSDLEERLVPLRRQLQRLPKGQRAGRLKQFRRQALEQMVHQKLIEVEARRLKVRVTERELKRAVEDVMQKNKLSKEQLQEALKAEGKTLADYKEQMLGPQLLRFKVINMQVRPRVSVSEDEIKSLYQKNLRSLGVEAKVRARHIFVSLPANAKAAVVAERKKQASALLVQLKKGADFAKLAKEKSQDSVTKADGGDLGYFGRGTLPSAIEDVVFAAKKGALLGPLRTERGFHLIELTDRKESSARPYKEVRRQLRAQLMGEKMEKTTKSWLAEVRKRSHVEVRL
ncbi:MAG: peptidylprolyl isomerase [Deltaproteobacteria bacterium]|nr:peptidylprolyl isomerase [Deltaproteobacteria bacterium]